MAKKVLMLMFMIVAVVCAQQSTEYQFSQIIGHKQVSDNPNGFFNPAGPEATRSFKEVLFEGVTKLTPCADFLSRSADFGGCYPIGKYHIGEDLKRLVGGKLVLGGLVVPPSDGKIIYVSWGPSWGITDCDTVKKLASATNPDFIPVCDNKNAQSNAGVVSLHQLTNGQCFVNISGHVLNYNTQTGKVFVENETILAGRPFALVGDLDTGPHLHEGIIYPASCNPALWFPRDRNQLGKMPDARYPDQNGFVDPIAFLTDPTHMPDNYISTQGTQTAAPKVVSSTPAAVVVPIGGVFPIPVTSLSIKGFIGTMQNAMSTPMFAPNPTSVLPSIFSLLGIKTALAANQTVTTQNLVYVPSGLPAGNYPMISQSLFQNQNGDSPGATVPANITISVVSEATGGLNKTPPAGAVPVIGLVGTSGGMTTGKNFFVYVTGASIDPASVQAVLNGLSCPAGCLATKLDAGSATTTSFAGSFGAVTQPGAYKLQLRNGANGALSNSFGLTIYPAITATCNPNSSSAAVNTPVTFTSTASGGLSPYSSNWNNAAVGTGSTITSSFANGGFFAQADLDVTDSLGNQAHTSCGTNVLLGQPSISGILPIGTPTALQPFLLGISGVNFASNLEVWFCQEPGRTVCSQYAASINVGNYGLDGTEAALFSTNLASGNWVAKVRNGSSGVFSNFSSPFTVAAPAAPFTLTPPTQSVSVVDGQSVPVDVTIQSLNGFKDTVSVGMWCMQAACPAGFTYSFPYGNQNLTANASLPLRITFSPSITATPGIYNYEYRASFGSTTAVAKIAVTVTAPIANTPTLAFTPPTLSVSVAAGQSVFVDNTLKGSNNTAGNASLALYCMQSACPVGVSVRFQPTVALAANGSAATGVTFYTTSATPPGAYNFEQRGALGSLNAVAKIAVTVTAPVSTADFTAVALSSNISTVQGSNNSLQATITPSGGLTGPVSMTVAGAPAGVTIAPASGNVTGTGAITLTSAVSVASTAAVGSYPLTATLTGGGKTKTVAFTLVITKAAATTGTVAVAISGYSGSIICLLNGVSITAPGNFANQPTGSKVVTSCAAPAGYTVTSITPSTQNLPGGGTVNFVVTLALIPAPPLSCSCSLSPNPINLGTGTTLFGSCTGGKGGYQYSLNGGSFQSGFSTPVLPFNGGTFSYSVTGKDSNGATASGSCALTVKGIPPNSIGFFPDSQPTHGLNFSGSISGNAFSSATTVWFYGPGCTSGCQQPPAGVAVLSPSNIRVVNVKLAAGLFQVEVRTAYGSARSSNFTVK